MNTLLSFPAVPEIFLLMMIGFIILVDLFVKQRRQGLTYALVQITLIITLGLVWQLYVTLPKTLLFNSHFIWDPMAAILKLSILTSTFFAFVYARHYIDIKKIPVGEYYLLGLFSVLGMLVLVSAYSLLTVFLGLELVSLPLYVLIGLQRHSPLSSEAAMKYFIMGTAALGMMLYGLSILYGETHSLLLGDIASAVAMHGQEHFILVFSLVFIIAGVIFKLGAAPFHVWVPDAYQGAASSVTAFMSSAPKIAAIGMTLRLLVNAMPDLAPDWQWLLTLVAVLSFSFGNLVAIVQTNLKRMLAYSAIAHMGYVLLGLIAGTPEGYAAAVFYIVAYSTMSLAAFALLVLLSSSGIEIETIADLRGLNIRSPWLAFLMLLVMFSMAGIPPTVGFIAKLGLLEALIRVHNLWLAALALLFAIIGAYYYLNVVKVMYFEAPEEGKSLPIVIAWDSRLAISINSLLLLIAGLLPGALIQLSRRLFE